MARHSYELSKGEMKSLKKLAKDKHGFNQVKPFVEKKLRDMIDQYVAAIKQFKIIQKWKQKKQKPKTAL